MDQIQHLLGNCQQELARANLTRYNLEALRYELPENFHPYMIMVINGIKNTVDVLADLHKHATARIDRVGFILPSLTVVLPCLTRSLQDIQRYIDDTKDTKEIRWRKMYNEMMKELGGISLMERFRVYNEFLGLLVLLLLKSPSFDLNMLEILRGRILEWREKRGIDPPPMTSTSLIPINTMLEISKWSNSAGGRSHWAENIFSRPLSSRTEFKHSRESISFGPHEPWHNMVIPPTAKILFKRNFPQARSQPLVVQGFVDSDGSPILSIKTFYSNGYWHSTKGFHELCIERRGSSLQLSRWSFTAKHAKPWAILDFITWEEMVLFHSTFLALKARNPLAVGINPKEFALRKEKRMFQAQIIDNDFKHSLIVYQEESTKGLRLNAAVWEGELKKIPVWTAFVTHQSASQSWMAQKSKHRIWLKDLTVYVFCKEYKEERQRRSRSGAFELRFVNEDATKRFMEIFYPAPPTPSESTGEEAG